MPAAILLFVWRRVKSACGHFVVCMEEGDIVARP